MKKLNKLNKQYFISSILKKGMTTKYDLEFLAKKLDLDLKIIWLKDYNPAYKGPQIINMGNNLIGGSHWVATYNNQYFDPFGINPPPNLKDIQWIPLQIQSIKSGHCGQYALLFLYYAKKNEIDQFYNMFCIES